VSPVICVMDTSKNVVEVELTSGCVCVSFDDVMGEFFPSEHCRDCWQDSVEDLEVNVLLPWLDAHGAVDGDYVKIDGEGMGWLRKAGTLSLEVERDAFASDVLNNLTFDGDFRLVFRTFNGDFRLVFRLEGDVLSARRTSHDEPMGASFVFRLVKAERAEEVI